MTKQLVSVSMVDQIAVIAVNNPPVNTINREVRTDLRGALAEVRKRSGVKAVVLLCEGSTFFSGADVGEFSGPPMEAEYRTVFGELESLTVPVVAGLHGTVLGGGLEIALACHYRVAAEGTRVGLPEVTLGIIPGAGGTQRLPRLVGVEKTLELLLNAQPIDAKAALGLGILDALIHGDIREETIAYAKELVAARKGPRRTADRKIDPATATPEIVERFSIEAKRRYPNRSAALTAIEAVSAAARLSFDEGLLFEERLVHRAKATVECKALVHLFLAERGTRKVPALPADLVPRAIQRAGIIGAGTMGSGIAMCFANANIPVVVIDANADAVGRGLAIIDKSYESMVQRGRLEPDEKARRIALIKGSVDYADLSDADVIIEAVFENMELKKKIFEALDAVVKPGAMLATNTSTLDVGDIATSTHRAGDVLGLHFFSPANVMPLLEIVRTDQTEPGVIRTAFDLAKRLRKTPVLSGVCYGFIGNRMMEGYAREAELMVLEGAEPRQVDGVLERWGMAMGILAVFDMAGVDVSANIHKANADKYPPDPTYYQADLALQAAGRVGQKVGKGYYKYLPGDRGRHDDPEALALLRTTATRLGVTPRSHSDDEMLERCLYPLINEGMRILEEGIALRAADIDVVWTAGYGFPRYRGGPMFYADTIGLKAVLDGMRKYGAIFGPMHWEPAALLVRLVEQGLSLGEWEASRLAATG